MKRILLIPFLAVGTLLAAPELKLELSASQQVERTVDGVVQTSYEASESTQPGDKLAYTITYTNVGDAPAQGAGITGVIPEGTRFLEVLDMPEAGDGLVEYFFGQVDGQKHRRHIRGLPRVPPRGVDQQAHVVPLLGELKRGDLLEEIDDLGA